jgi:hypothetical protein
MNASLNVSPMCRRCGDPVDLDAEICPSCGAIASPTAIRTSAYSTMSGKTKGLIATAFVCVLGLAGYTLMPGSMHNAPADTNASDTTRAAEADRNRARETVPESRPDASMSAALDAVRESIQRHDMESAKLLLAAILALHRDNPEALELRNEVKMSESQAKPVAPVARASTAFAKAVDTRRAATVVDATSRKPASKSGGHEHAARESSKKTPVVANGKVAPHKVMTAKASAPRPSVVVREATVRQVRPDVPKTSQDGARDGAQDGASPSVQTASGAPLISSGIQQAPLANQDGSGGPVKSERWRDRGGMR